MVRDPLNLRAEVYVPEKHAKMIEAYMATTPVVNNRTPKALRLSDYSGDTGALFLVIDETDHILAVSSVVCEEGLFGRAAKIYGRFHISKGVPHTIIDRFFEPMTFAWCEEHEIDKLFLTINSGNFRVLDWVCRRMGERRRSLRVNPFAPDLGREKRCGFVPLNHLIFERHCWQYALYYSKDRHWFLERPQRSLDIQAAKIFEREFPIATQNWN
jgi:hypothetical protein